MDLNPLLGPLIFDPVLGRDHEHVLVPLRLRTPECGEVLSCTGCSNNLDAGAAGEVALASLDLEPTFLKDTDRHMQVSSNWVADDKTAATWAGYLLDVVCG